MLMKQKTLVDFSQQLVDFNPEADNEKFCEL